MRGRKRWGLWADTKADSTILTALQGGIDGSRNLVLVKLFACPLAASEAGRATVLDIIEEDISGLR